MACGFKSRRAHLYLGVAKLVSHLFWEQGTASSSLVAQTSPKGHVEFFIHIIPSSLETEQCDVVSWVYDAPSPSGKAEDFDSSIASVQIRPAQPRCNLAGGCIFLFVINGGGRT